MAVTWDRVQLTPVVLIKGSESVFADRALDRLLTQARAEDPNVEITRIQAAAYEAGQLICLASPSLFGERRAIVVDGAESMNDAFLTDAMAYLEAPESDVWFIVRHSGTNRGKKLQDAMTKVGEVVTANPLKSDSDKADFVLADLHRARRRITREAVHSLLDAVGSDLRELDSAVRQLVADTSGEITHDVVDRYYSGRVEATGFRVADAAIAGRAGEAIALARHALATGTQPVPLVGALANKLRNLVKVGTAKSRGMNAKDLGMHPWQFQRTERELRGWTPDGLARAIMAAAQADAEVKGASRDPAYAIEKVLLAVAQARSGR